ncbi:MAG: TolC family protein [Bacteroides sp.]|nr:TolC family protein [Bacteroides sp.]
MRPILTLIAAVAALSASAGITLDECLTRAEENYPAIAGYDIASRQTEVALSDINRGWLPRLNVYAQATLQNDGPSWPDALSNMLAQMNQNFRGLSRFQYKAGVDVSQTIWDGGASRAARNVQRAQADVKNASVAVELYAVRERVENIFFGILLMEQQIKQTRESLTLLEANHSRLEAMVAGGTAMKSDAAMVEAQILATGQKLTEAEAALDSYRRMLSIYTGMEIGPTPLDMPEAELPTDDTPLRPELKLLDSRSSLNSALLRSSETSVMPRIGFFAQAYYGYPGLNYFQSMVNRDMSFNILGGVKLSWNIDSFYTRSNSRRSTGLDNESLRTDRETFLLNTRLLSTQQRRNIEALRSVMETDSRIVQLRTEVRLAAESQLSNGVIDTTALLAKITDENQARLTEQYHRIQLIQQIYQLRHTLNR